jgi:urease accessory protein
LIVGSLFALLAVNFIKKMFYASLLCKEDCLFMNMLSTPQANALVDGIDPRWRALFRGEFYAASTSSNDLQTRMGKTMHFGPLRVQRPFYPEGSDLLHMYLLHPPGGLVGGDQLVIQVQARERAKVLVTTPSAGKLYRNETELKQVQQVEIKVGVNCAVEYLPQENIIFNGAKGELNTRIDIDDNGLFIGWEITCLGRPEGDALFTQGTLKQTLAIYQDEQLLFIDRFNLDAQSGVLNSRVGLQHYSVFATFVINRNIDSVAMQSLLELQEACNAQSDTVLMGVTQKNGILIIRALAHRAEPVRNQFERIWQLLRPSVYDREACTPRIWNT